MQFFVGATGGTEYPSCSGHHPVLSGTLYFDNVEELDPLAVWSQTPTAKPAQLLAETVRS